MTHAALGKSCDFTRKDDLNISSFDYCSQSKLDAFYLQLDTGSTIPNGIFDGKVQITQWPIIFQEPEEFLLEQIWHGKIFYRQNSKTAILFNRIQEINHVYEKFPAHVYFGASLFDAKKKSIVIDYTHNQDIEGYRPDVDWLVNNSGFSVRDEIRQVNDTLYLGRAYVHGSFLLNFVLQSAN